MKLKSKILLLFMISILLITSGVSYFSIEKLYNKNLKNAIKENTIYSRYQLGVLERYLANLSKIELDDIYGYIEDISVGNARIYEIYLNDRMVFKNHSFDIKTDRKELRLNKSNYILREIDDRLYIMITAIYANDVNKVRLVDITDIQWIEEQRKQQYIYVFSIMILVLLFSCFAVKKVLDLLFFDMDRLRIMTEKIGEGDYGYSIENYRKDEIGGLVESFNNMGKLVNSQIEEIKKDKEVKERFLRNFNHEIKTPLTSIIGISDMLVNGLVKESDEKEMIETINLEGKRILSLQRVVLKELELDKINTEKVSLKKVYEEVKNIYRYACNQKDISIDFEGEDYELDINFKLFIQGVGNIIDNCIRYSEKGDSIIFRSMKDYLEIVDMGPGIDEKIKNNIFLAFEKSDSSKGQGIGLYLSKRIMDKHGFNISAYSSSKGSVFKIDYR